ncbi:MAG: DUF2934 domain-containing protein [Povalibacter sp.]|jgi:hypothetical protein
MQISSGTPDSAKKSRAKPQTDVVAAAEPKKPRARKKIALKTETVSAEPVVTSSAEDLSGQIEVAAYFIAAQRNFTPGHELDDWLAAEHAVRSQQAA